MREQDLRDLLSRYTPSGEGAPAASSIRGRATRRRLVPVGVAAVAVVTAGALLVPQVLTQPAVPAPAASPTVPATPASGTPMPTPSATPSPVVTPTLSCPEIRDAWREALTTPVELPPGLGANPRLIAVRGESVTVGGEVNGRLVRHYYPHGLEGDSFVLPSIADGATLLLAELTEQRIVYGELWESGSPRRWRFHVQHGPDAEPRLLVDSRDGDGVGGPYPYWVEGDFLRWFEVLNASGDQPERQRVMQVALNDPDAGPQVALEVVDSELGHPVLLDDRILFGQNDTWRAYDRATLRETSAPLAMPPAGSWKVQRGNEILYDRDTVDGAEDLVQVDVMTGQTRPILKGAAPNMVTIEGDSALLLRGRTVTLVDLNSGNELEIMDDNGTTEGMQVTPVLTEEFVLRITDGSNGDPGSMARVSDLPTAIPTC